MELKLYKLTKKFSGTEAVSSVSYTFSEGVYGLLGVNGAGKTTLMRMMCGLLHPSEGKITCNGEDIFRMEETYRQRLGYLPQEFGFYPEFSVYDYLMYIASLKGLRPAVAKRRIEILLSQVGMKSQKHKKMKKLSGGMKRRVGIAQAMLNNPEILILDEPTAGLDPNERIRFRNLISELSKDRMVLLSTHIVSDIEYIADQILLMEGGKLRAAGSSEALLLQMPERVWSVMVSKEEMQTYMKQYKISNVKNVSGGVKLRILSEQKPAKNAVQETAILEDLFLDYFGERKGMDDDTI